MKLFTKQFLLAALAGATIAFATGCVSKPSRPVSFETANPEITTVESAPVVVQTTPAGGVINASDVRNFGETNVFAPPADSSQANNVIEKRTDGGTQVGDEIRGISTLPPILFAFDRSGIEKTEYGKFQALKDYLARNPSQKVIFEGHCDWRGTSDYNMALGDRRANAAKRYAMSIGIPASKIQTRSLGSTQAKERGTEAQMAQDRRAEIVILVK